MDDDLNSKVIDILIWVKFCFDYKRLYQIQEPSLFSRFKKRSRLQSKGFLRTPLIWRETLDHSPIAIFYVIDSTLIPEKE